VLKRRDLLVEYVPQFVPHELRDVPLYEGVVTYLQHRRPDLPAWSAEMVLHTCDFSTARYAVTFGALSGGGSQPGPVGKSHGDRAGLLVA
jgi:hypothetical protein